MLGFLTHPLLHYETFQVNKWPYFLGWASTGLTRCEGWNISERPFLLGRMSQGLAADSLGAEDLGEVELGASGDKQDLQVRSCLGLMLEKDICGGMFTWNHASLFDCRRSRRGCCRFRVVLTVVSHCWHLHSSFYLAMRCVLTSGYAVKHVFQPALF